MRKKGNKKIAFKRIPAAIMVVILLSMNLPGISAWGSEAGAGSKKAFAMDPASEMETEETQASTDGSEETGTQKNDPPDESETAAQIGGLPEEMESDVETEPQPPQTEAVRPDQEPAGAVFTITIIPRKPYADILGRYTSLYKAVEPYEVKVPAGENIMAYLDKHPQPGVYRYEAGDLYDQTMVFDSYVRVNEGILTVYSGNKALSPEETATKDETFYTAFHVSEAGDRTISYSTNYPKETGLENRTAKDVQNVSIMSSLDIKTLRFDHPDLNFKVPEGYRFAGWKGIQKDGTEVILAQDAVQYQSIWRAAPDEGKPQDPYPALARPIDKAEIFVDHWHAQWVAEEEPAGESTGNEDGAEAEQCPYVLNLTTGKLTNENGQEVKDGLLHTENGFRVNETVFTLCKKSHKHTLSVTGESSKSLTIHGSEAWDVVFSGVKVGKTEISKVTNVNFSGDNQFQNEAGGQALTVNASLSIQSGSKVTASTNGDTPISAGSGRAKVLDLIMYEAVPVESLIKIAGDIRTIPHGCKRIAVMDNIDGTWLTGQITVKTADGKEYVRGTSAQLEDGSWDADADNHYSDQNHYGQTYYLDKQSNTYGIYQAVRVPVTYYNMKVSVPTELVFQLYTKGTEEFEDDVLVSGKIVFKNNSNIVGDYLWTGDRMKEFDVEGMAVDVSYNGISVGSEGSSAKNGYSLNSLHDIQEKIESGETRVKKPGIALELEATGVGINAYTEDGRIQLDETLTGIQQKWFEAEPNSTSLLQLRVPANTLDSKFHQNPDTDSLLQGVHYLQLRLEWSGNQKTN